MTPRLCSREGLGRRIAGRVAALSIFESDNSALHAHDALLASLFSIHRADPNCNLNVRDLEKGTSEANVLAAMLGSELTKIGSSFLSTSISCK